MKKFLVASAIILGLGVSVHTVEAKTNNHYGATAMCRDNTYSWSANHRGTCSHHGGVKYWYK